MVQIVIICVSYYPPSLLSAVFHVPCCAAFPGFLLLCCSLLSDGDNAMVGPNVCFVTSVTSNYMLLTYTNNALMHLLPKTIQENKVLQGIRHRDAERADSFGNHVRWGTLIRHSEYCFLFGQKKSSQQDSQLQKKPRQII